MNTSSQEFKQVGMALLGAVAGGVAGYFIFFWLIHQGFYGISIPGALIGMGARLGRVRQVAFPVVCAIAAVALGVFCEWSSAPFTADASLGYFLAHLQDLRPLTLILIALGAVLAFWVPYRRGS